MVRINKKSLIKAHKAGRRRRFLWSSGDYELTGRVALSSGKAKGLILAQKRMGPPWKSPSEVKPEYHAYLRELV